MMRAILALSQIFLVGHHQHEPQHSLSENKPKKERNPGKHPTLGTDIPTSILPPRNHDI
jgi:hypothetical protein